MKSAYEIAMERLKKEQPEIQLSDAQKDALAEVDATFTAKVAEREIFLRRQLAEAKNQEDRQAIQTQLTNERLRLEEEREAAKNKIRKGAS